MSKCRRDDSGSNADAEHEIGSVSSMTSNLGQSRKKPMHKPVNYHGQLQWKARLYLDLSGKQFEDLEYVEKPPPEIDKDTEMSEDDATGFFESSRSSPVALFIGGQSSTSDPRTLKTNIAGSHNATTTTNSNTHNTHNNSRPMTDCNNIITNHHYYQAPVQNYNLLFVVLVVIGLLLLSQYQRPIADLPQAAYR
ncbi:hypothetical protein L218DRAFT_1001749 [Marasmius fiardii PR-910]|nr:hypothetical protein L218DRAFT_1001749 [Marasmius fiardii PR-910]